MLGEKAMDIGSHLFVGESGDGSGKVVFDYANENMVQTIVQKFLDDAVTTCNKLIAQYAGSEKQAPRLQSRSECSMFKARPDHMVVYDMHSHAPLVTIEVKKPLAKGNLLEHSKVCGQGFDYLMATKMSGNVCPMHITTTVDESYVAWLPENDDTVKTFNTIKEADLKDVLSEIFDKASRLSGGAQFTQSPLKEEEKWEQKDEASVTTFTEEKVVREISSSKIFPSNHLFSLMVNTILCGMYSSTRRNSVSLLNEGVIVSNLALKLSEEKSEWTQISGLVIKGSIRYFTTPDLYAVDIIGFGATSKAFRVITRDGYEGVLKMYVKKTGDDNKTVLRKKEYDAKAKKSVNEEFGIFERTYPNMPVFNVKYADHHGLLMPFFKPLNPNSVSKDTIIKLFKKFQIRPSSYVYYKDEDIRWRHFGKYDNKIVAFDFNNMDNGHFNDDNRQKKISEQCEILFQRIRKKKISEQCENLFKRIPPEEKQADA
jgi:hypothetical protein